MKAINDPYSRVHSMNLDRYKKAKIKILKRDFGIPLTEEQTNNINNCTSEIAVDRYAKTYINERYNH